MLAERCCAGPSVPWIITGEGPTAFGRVHFSRTIDRQDAALCLRLLVIAGRYGDAVSRAEADALLDIHAVASDRQDGGQFDDLLTKAVVHHVMSASGLDVPARERALDPATPLAHQGRGLARRPPGCKRSWLKPVPARRQTPS